MKKLIPLMAACLIAAVAVAADSSNSPVFQIRAILDAPSGESEQMTIAHKERNAEVVNVRKTVLLDQSALKSAKLATDRLGQPQIDIIFTDEGAKRFADITRQNIGKRLAIIAGGQLCCAPTVMAEIAGGKAVINGSFSKQEAKELAAKISEAITKR